MRSRIFMFLAFAAFALPAVSEQYYEFIPGSGDVNPYVIQAQNVKNSSEISEIRNSILHDSSLSKDEKVALISQVGDIQMKQISHEHNVEMGWIIAEGVISGAIRGANIYFNKNPTAAAAVDAFAQQILEGNVRSAIVKGMETKDWSGVLDVAKGFLGDFATDLVLGKVFEGLGKTDIVKNAVSKVENVVSKGYDAITAKTFKSINDTWTDSAIRNTALIDDVENVLNPKIAKLKGEISDLSKKLADATTDTEKASIEASLISAKTQLLEASNLKYLKEREIQATEELINKAVSEADKLRNAVDFSKETLNDFIQGKIKNFIKDVGENAFTSAEEFIEKMSAATEDSITSEILRESDASTQAAVDAFEAAYAASEAEYNRQMQEIASRYSDGSLVLSGGVEENVYIDSETGEVIYDDSGRETSNILNDIFNGDMWKIEDDYTDAEKIDSKIETLKDALTKNLDKSLAEKLVALLENYAQDGMQKISDLTKKEIEALIDKYAPGTASAEKLKDLLNDILTGNMTGPDIANATTVVITDTARKLINESNLPQPVKDAANAAIDGLAENGIDGLTTNVGDFINNYVTDQLGPEAGAAVKEIFDAVVTPTEDAWNAVLKNAETIGKAIGQKALAWAEKTVKKQIDKLIAKYPALKGVLDRLGINGEGIVKGVKNVLSVLWNAKDLKEAFKTLANMAKNFLKNIAGKLIDFALEKAFQWLASKLVPKAVKWATATLEKWKNSTNNPLIKKALTWLQGQISNCAKCAAAKIKVGGVGDKLVKWIEEKAKEKKEGSGDAVLDTGNK